MNDPQGVFICSWTINFLTNKMTITALPAFRYKKQKVSFPSFECEKSGTKRSLHVPRSGHVKSCSVVPKGYLYALLKISDTLSCKECLTYSLLAYLVLMWYKVTATSVETRQKHLSLPHCMEEEYFTDRLIKPVINLFAFRINRVYLQNLRILKIIETDCRFSSFIVTDYVFTLFTEYRFFT